MVVLGDIAMVLEGSTVLEVAASMDEGSRDDWILELAPTVAEADEVCCDFEVLDLSKAKDSSEDTEDANEDMTVELEGLCSMEAALGSEELSVSCDETVLEPGDAVLDGKTCTEEDNDLVELECCSLEEANRTEESETTLLLLLSTGTVVDEVEVDNVDLEGNELEDAIELLRVRSVDVDAELEIEGSVRFVELGEIVLDDFDNMEDWLGLVRLEEIDVDKVSLGMVEPSTMEVEAGLDVEDRIEMLRLEEVRVDDELELVGATDVPRTGQRCIWAQGLTK
ncbi:hypothetical protein BKA65DRAFT_484545 [Rhexocercosporidium sp. MPI-PUGE-AT-0058]|nr:hypothetical protein BKA65DRAFT_484545 [Rhexocercosporidium sp. MPI-PUGE-AT-0058]